MKYILLTLILFISGHRPSYSQGVMNWKYFRDFDTAQKQVIMDNWTQYFKDDIYGSLDSSNENVYPVKFDSYGSIYPDPAVLQGVNFNPTKRNAKDNWAYSLHDIYTSEANHGTIIQNVTHVEPKIPAEFVGLYKELLRPDYRGVGASDSFYSKWDRLHAAQTLKEINAKVAHGAFTHIIFFIHGYNVPYSLANVQLIALKRAMNESVAIDIKKVLFIPIFWTSNDQKNLNIEDEGSFDVSNKTGLNIEGLRNGTSFLYYSNRAYYASIAFRKLLNGIDPDVKIVVFAHSLGATIATSAFINTVTKLHTREEIKLTPNPMRSCTFTIGSITDSLTKEIVTGLAMEPIPTRGVRVFLSAPAIPGGSTFADINGDCFVNKVIYSTINKNDEMLTKRVVNIPWISEKNMSATTLGCDLLDAKNAKRIVETRTNSRFIYKEVSKSDDHDILTYLNQAEYFRFLEDFLEERDPKKCNELGPVLQIKCEFAQEYLRLETSAAPYLLDDTIEHSLERQNISHLASTRRNINTVGIPLKNVLFKIEALSFHDERVSANSRELITSMTDPYLVVVLERAIKEDQTEPNDYFKNKLLDELSNHLNMLMDREYTYYNYETRKKKVVKFLSVRTGNDLFTFTRKNLDRDYTGSLLVELGTDYLNLLRRRPIKSYQTLLYGFDVYTPSFYDTSKFKNFDDFDTLDRPHASFQYFGWSKICISKYNRLRWKATLKLGKIGGRIGGQFQTLLHQDVSYSLRPKGWDAQISNGGRLGVSLETQHEYQFYQSSRRTNRFWNLNLSGMNENKIGTYMTTFGLGLQMSNKGFSGCNQNFINQRTRQGVVLWTDHIMYSVAWKSAYVLHNTMLEGYGIFNETEKRNDTFTPNSIYFLNSDRVQRLVHTANVCVSYTTRYATIFYNWFCFSPETKLASLKTNDSRAWSINLANRWHHFAEIGISLNIH